MLKRIFIFFFLIFFFPACSPKAEDGARQVCFDDRCIGVEVAQTQEAHERGLQFRESLERDKGMLFIFSQSRPHSFWMKNTLIPLDIIWLDSKKHVVFIAPNIPPCKTKQCPVYAPGQNASYVLEVNAGVAAELELKVGDRVRF